MIWNERKWKKVKENKRKLKKIKENEIYNKMKSNETEWMKWNIMKWN